MQLSSEGTTPRTPPGGPDEEATISDPRSSSARRNPPRQLLAAAGALTVAAAACAAWFGYSWYSDAHSTALATASARDVVLADAEQGVLNFNTLDYHKAAAGLQLWLESSTGTLHSQLAQNLSQEASLVQSKKEITSAKILDGAVTQLNTSAGTATVIVAVTVTVTPATGKPASEKESEVGQLTRTSSGWRLSSLGFPDASSSPTSSASATPAPSASAKQ
jgi:Mce-associated membrane protein